MVKTTRARNKIKQWFKAESRKDTEHSGREQLQKDLKKQGLPAQKIVGSPLLADIVREMGFRKADDFYIALGAGKIAPKVVVQKVMQRLKQGESAAGEPTPADTLSTGRRSRRPESSSSAYGIDVDGIDDVMLRLARCCHPVPGDPILGYISLGRGITIHRRDCPNARALARDPERLTRVSWSGEGKTAFKVEIHVDGWDRHRLLEDLSRAFAEAGVNILEAHCTVDRPDGAQPLRGRGGRHARAGRRGGAPAQHRGRVRRLPRHARPDAGRRATGATQDTTASASGTTSRRASVVSPM